MLPGISQDRTRGGWCKEHSAMERKDGGGIIWRQKSVDRRGKRSSNEKRKTKKHSLISLQQHSYLMRHSYGQSQSTKA
jgi:hypothetical protein